MDPDEALKQIRRLAKDIYDGPHRPSNEMGVWLAELVSALDEWLSKGGFPPKAWAKR